MEIKRLYRHGPASKKSTAILSNARSIRWAALSIAGVLLIAVIMLAWVYYGMFLYKTGKAADINEFFRMAAQSKFRIIPNWFKGLLAAPEEIAIDIKYMDYQKLAYMREIALADRFITASAQDYVPAKIRYRDKIFDAEIRLKGDWAQPLRGEKWSFRVKIKGDKVLFGMSKFSLHHPRERNYIYEWIFHETLNREKIISPRYKFIDVILNGKDLGIYALEEHFENKIIENNGYREGLIIKFNENILWDDRVRQGSSESAPTGLQSQSSADIGAFRMNYVFKDPVLRKQFITAKDLLESFRRGLEPAAKVFDIKKLAKYFAISELMAALHGAGSWINLRFYYNPVTGFLEPVGFDAMVGITPPWEWDMFREGVIKEHPDDFYAFHARIFSDTVFFEAYVKALEQVSQKHYLDNLFKDIDAGLQKNLAIIYKGYSYFVFSKDIFYQNQKTIQARLNPSKGLRAYFCKSYDKGMELKLGNLQSLPIEVPGISYKDSPLVPAAGKIVLRPKIPSEAVEYRTVLFPLPRGFEPSDAALRELKVNYKLIGMDDARYETVLPYSDLSEDFIRNDFIRQDPNVSSFAFLSVDESAKNIYIKPGEWDIDRDLVIPAGYKVICPEGVQLNVLNSAKVLSYSPLEFIGSEEHPILVCSKDASGQGIVLINADGDSILRYVIFRNLSAPSRGGWELTGAVTFYQSPVQISHCQFSGNNSEDSLNVVRTDFSIDRSFFEKTSSDAVDSDFSRGQITATSFVYCGNDAIDASGTRAALRDIFINGAGDKGISAGEDSQITADGIEIKNAKIALACKDMSEAAVKAITVSDCEIGFALYQKKPEFGPASMTVAGLAMNMVKIPYLVEAGSTLDIDGKRITTNQDRAKEFLDRYLKT